MKITPPPASVTGTPTSSAGGDLGPPGFPGPTVVGFQGRPLCADAPSVGDAYIWNGAEWCPAPPAGSTSGIVLITGAVSKPPTEAELVAVIGAPVAGTTYLLTDSGTGFLWFVTSNGIGYQYLPLVQAGGTASAVFSLTAAPEGGWSWFGDPRAVYDPTADATVFGYLKNPGGKPTVAAYLHATSTTTTPVDLYPAQPTFEIDDHDNPALLIRDSDGRYIAWFSTHGGGDIYEAVSTNPNDATAWDATTNINADLAVGQYTYPSPVQLTGEANDPIYLFWRSATTTPGKWSYAKRNGTASTFPGTVTYFANFTYLKIAHTSTTRIDFAASNHPNDTGVDHGIFHFYYSAGNVYESDGTLIGAIGTVIVDETNATQVYDGSTTKGWIWDIAMDGTDPRVVYVTFPSTTDHRYNYGSYSAGWTTHQIVAGGTYIATTGVGPNPVEVYYSGGVILDHTDPDIVYCSIQSGSAWEMWKYVTADAGVSWTPTALTTSGSKNARPVSVRNYAAELKVMWWAGTYNSYVAYSLATMGSST